MAFGLGLHVKLIFQSLSLHFKPIWFAFIKKKQEKFVFKVQRPITIQIKFYWLSSRNRTQSVIIAARSLKQTIVPNVNKIANTTKFKQTNVGRIALKRPASRWLW